VLSSLRIKNLALVEDLALDLGPGFTVLTGETGAGKSLLVDALSLLVGAKADAEAVRRGEERATVEAVIEGRGADWLAFLRDKGLPEEVPAVLRREVGSGGRSRAWINGAPCAAGDLREAGRLWMRLTSQHDHQNLLSEDRHLALLDEVLGLEPDLGGVVAALREAEGALKARRQSEAQRERRLEELEEQLADLAKLAPKPLEATQLRAEREPLRHAAQLEAAFREAAESLGEALPQVKTALHAWARAIVHFPDGVSDQDRLRSLSLELEDLLESSRDQARHWSTAGAEKLESLEARLATFEKLARRQRCEPDELSERWKALQEEQRLLLGGGESAEALEKKVKEAAKAYAAAASKLHDRRAASLPKLESEVHSRLSRLGMKGARLQLALAIAEEAGSAVEVQGRPARVALAGYSALQMRIESNPGEGFRPLGKIASGGELSRLMLSLLGAGIALGADTEALTLVLDEVDAGLGGETALKVGEAIAELGSRHQVLAVTHLAQVASRAGRHLAISKHTTEGRTRSRHDLLEGEARVRELARLLSGHPDRPEALEHAKVLLEA
jgi:DNA repair protein RecN (Recombination protein N)